MPCLSTSQSRTNIVTHNHLTLLSLVVVGDCLWNKRLVQFLIRRTCNTSHRSISIGLTLGHRSWSGYAVFSAASTCLQAYCPGDDPLVPGQDKEQNEYTGSHGLFARTKSQYSVSLLNTLYLFITRVRLRGQATVRTWQPIDILWGLQPLRLSGSEGSELGRLTTGGGTGPQLLSGVSGRWHPREVRC
jgi:hypothetical protein